MEPLDRILLCGELDKEGLERYFEDGHCIVLSAVFEQASGRDWRNPIVVASFELHLSFHYGVVDEGDCRLAVMMIRVSRNIRMVDLIPFMGDYWMNTSFVVLDISTEWRWLHMCGIKISRMSENGFVYHACYPGRTDLGGAVSFSVYCDI